MYAASKVSRYTRRALPCVACAHLGEDIDQLSGLDAVGRG